MTIPIITNRERLCFVDEVRKQFAFLERASFRCVYDSPTLVRFASSEILVDIFHGTHSYEIGIIVGFVNSHESYTFSELLRLCNNEEAASYKNYAAHTVEGVAEGVSLLSVRFKKLLSLHVLEDEFILERLKKARNKWSEDYAREVCLENHRSQAKEAWKAKDFETFIELLAPLQDYLSVTEISKLEYARKKFHGALGFVEIPLRKCFL